MRTLARPRFLDHASVNIEQVRWRWGAVSVMSYPLLASG
jgi:hypothetical protein